MTTTKNLVAQAAARLKAELAGMYPRENIDLSDVRTVLAAIEAHERGVQGEASDDLRVRCAEILGWQKTGILTGDALRSYAAKKLYATEANALQCAESDTAREAFELICTTPPTAPAQDAQVEGIDAIVTSLYRRFKDWSRRGFGPDDVTWCEVRAEVLALIAATPSPQAEQQPLSDEERAKLLEAADHLSGDGHFMDAADADWAAEWLRGIVTKESSNVPT